MPTLRLFASIRVAAGTGRDEIAGGTVAEVLDGACQKYGSDFEAILQQCRVWVNGEEAAADGVVTDTDEIAVLPPVSGGARPTMPPTWGSTAIDL